MVVHGLGLLERLAEAPMRVVRGHAVIGHVAQHRVLIADLELLRVAAEPDLRDPLAHPLVPIFQIPHGPVGHGPRSSVAATAATQDAPGLPWNMAQPPPRVDSYRTRRAAASVVRTLAVAQSTTLFVDEQTAAKARRVAQAMDESLRRRTAKGIGRPPLRPPDPAGCPHPACRRQPSPTATQPERRRAAEIMVSPRGRALYRLYQRTHRYSKYQESRIFYRAAAPDLY